MCVFQGGGGVGAKGMGTHKGITVATWHSSVDPVLVSALTQGWQLLAFSLLQGESWVSGGCWFTGSVSGRLLHAKSGLERGVGLVFHISA